MIYPITLKISPMMEIELEPEVEDWIGSMSDANYATLLVQANRL